MKVLKDFQRASAMVQRRSCKNSALTQGWKYIVTSHGKELKMRIMESRVKSIIREEVGRAIRSRLLREADGDDTDPDYPYMPDARSNRNRDKHLARGESAAETAAERAMAGVEGYPDYDLGGKADGKDSDGEAELVVDPSVEDFFNTMNPKPVGLIVDCSNMESGPGGFYPLYQATEAGILTKISEDIGVAAYAFSDMISESNIGEMPEGLWIAGMIDTAESGPPTFQIYNTV